MLAMAAFVLLTSAVFGFYALVFMYAVEDAFFETMLEQEADAQLLAHTRSGTFAAPRDRSMTVYPDASEFPPDLRQQHAAEPWRNEFSGRDGRHYHVRAIEPAAEVQRAWLVAEVSTQLVVRPMREQVFALLAGSGLLLVVIALLFGARLARRTAAPLSRLAVLIDAMQPSDLPRDLGRRFGDDEVGILARGLDALIARVQSLIAREREFTRDASHELRTPLAVIRSAAEHLSTQSVLSVANRQQVGFVRQSALQLEQTVTTLLMLAREEPVESTAGEDTRIVPILERVIVEQAIVLEGKAVSVSVEVPDESRLRLPESIVHILLSNLIGNAFAHSASGEVRIDVAHDRLHISNPGEHAADALRWPATAPFLKHDDSNGFGLGLTIVQRLCERYAIDLRIEREQQRVVASIALCARDET